MTQLHPFFSIIIPTYNRPKQLAVCLQSLARQKYPQDRFEVIVVDDGSEISLESVVAPFHRQINLTLYKQKNAGPAAARNYGALHTKGQFLAFTDDDCESHPGWLRALAAQFVKTPDCMIGGRTVNKLKNNLFSSASQLIVDIVYRHYNSNPEQARFFASNNLALPSMQFHQIGGFNLKFFAAASEDRELCDRWLMNGFRMIYVPQAIVYHAHALTFRTFCKQHFNYGRGAFCFHKIRASRGTGYFRTEFNFHLNIRNWLLFPFTQVSWKKSVPLAGMLLLWQVINMVGFIVEAVRENVYR